MARRRLVGVLVLAVIALSACGTATAAKGKDVPPGRVERVHGSAQRRVILSAAAVRRLGVEEVPIASAAGGGTVVPYAAVIYDPSGKAWVYGRVKPRSYQRERITVDRIDGDQAYLSAGPAVGTQVVSTGAAEVYGTEFFSDHE